jgi:MHS family proline/betaine transporter-like MFS transporter
MKNFKSIVSSSIGNILEWYDFGLFAIFSTLFSQLFFPSDDPHTSLIMTFSVLAIGFLCRPIGALIFGYMGDRTGRVQTLRLSVLMISLPTLLIGFLPTYQSVGILAPILLTLIRVWQGISLGGEYSGNLIYLTESAPKNLRATITSLAGTGANLGIMLATLVSAACSYFFSDELFHSIGWRVPYILSGLISLLIYYTRLHMEETKVFLQLKNENRLAKNPIDVVFKKNIPQVLRTIGLVCMGSTFYYLCFIYMPTFLLQALKFSLTKASGVMTLCIGAMIILVPLAGFVCDHFNRRKMLLMNVTFIFLLTVPGFYLLLHHQVIYIFFTLAIFTLMSSFEQATTSVAVVENYPTPARYTGLSLGYNIGNAIFGGTAPLICEWLLAKTHYLYAPAIYIVICALITGCVVFFTVKDTRGCDLVSKN